jgi:EAL and modified HD-GYP domain-containing signal transduction protein
VQVPARSCNRARDPFNVRVERPIQREAGLCPAFYETDQMPSPASVLTPGPGIFVARQPILDATRRVRGYELLYRRTAGARTSDGASADVATASVIEALFAIGFDTLTGGQKGFINVSRQLLLDGIPSVLPVDRVVLEVGPDIDADDDVVGACRELKSAGYAFALDQFAPGERTDPLVPFADFLKVGLLAQTGAAAPSGASNGRTPVVATNVETASEFQTAAADGYDFFQGFFLGRPELKGGRAVPAQHVAGIRLLHALHDPELTIHQLEDLVKHDATLCFLILRTVNSAAYGLRTTVQSIRDALVLLGRDTVRRWAALWALAGLGRHTHSELLTMATVRARCCELLAASASGEDAAADGFMVGLCSMLDAILEQPLPELLESTPVAGAVRSALLGEDNDARRTLDCVVAYERGDWARCVEAAASAGLDPGVLPDAYTEALRWSNELKPR